MKPRIRSIHFVGIAGVGMSGLAELLQRQGYAVSGSDLKSTATTLRLAELGVNIFREHEGQNVGSADVVVVSSAIPPDNPELREARSQDIPIVLRGEMLAEMMRQKNGIAVGGSHGKTTTTSLIGHVLFSAGLDPTSIVGGRVIGDDSSPGGSRLGQGAILVAEADESDGSFLLLNPIISVITNIDPEHLDHYGDFASLKSAFVRFADAVPFWGLTVVCIDHPGVRAIADRCKRRLTTYGFSPDAELVASEVRQDPEGVRFSVHQKGRALGDVRLPLPGDHNILNALACIAVALELDVPFKEAVQGLASFRGVERRYQRLGAAGDIRIVDDYAHHPAELKATLAAARSVHPGRIVSIFQPHRYTRTRDCMTEFAAAFDDSDLVIVSEIYPAGDAPIPGISGEVLAERIDEQGHPDVRFISSLKAVCDELPKHLKPGDLVLTLGAGDIANLGEQLLQKISDAPSSPGEGSA